MSSNKAKPSGLNKSEGTGIPSNIKPAGLKKDEKLTRDFTDDDKKSARIQKPNRNVDKGNATNIHGYRN